MNESFTLKNFYFYLIVIAFLTVAVFPYNPVLGTIGVIAWVLTASYAYRSVKKYNGIVNDQFNNLHKDFEKITERTIFSMPFPLVVTDREGTIVWHNSLFGELFDAEILKGKSLPAYIEDLADEEFLHRADSDDWKITNCTCLHYTRRDPETGRTSKRVRWEQTARPVLDETTGRWEVKVEPWREFKRPYLSNGDLVDVVQAVDPHLLEYYGK